MDACEFCIQDSSCCNGVFKPLYEGDRKRLLCEIDNIRRSIDGELNRLTITGDKEEFDLLGRCLSANITNFVNKNRYRLFIESDEKGGNC